MGIVRFIFVNLLFLATDKNKFILPKLEEGTVNKRKLVKLLLVISILTLVQLSSYSLFVFILATISTIGFLALIGILQVVTISSIISIISAKELGVTKYHISVSFPKFVGNSDNAFSSRWCKFYHNVFIKNENEKINFQI